MQYVYLLSGKPAPNTTVEYYSQMAIVAPELFNISFDKFVETYYKRDGKYGKYEFKNGYTKSIVTKMVAEKSITVSKEQCLELPPRHFEEVLVQLEDFAMIEYGKVLANFLNTIVSLDDEVITIDRISKLAQMMKLREMATGFYIDDTKQVYSMSENKLNALMELLRKLGKNQVVIWCNFVYEIECLEKALKDRGYSVVTAYSKSKNLDESIQKFKKNEAQVIIANPQTLKYGITFVNCKYAIYNSLSYSYDDYYQSRDRIYRYGQKSECTYYNLLS
jgi:SNF2 family DNA or RNA helicase